MSLITNNIKSILAIKIKTRHDSYTDQYARIFMVKMCIVSSLVMGVDWFHDTVSCMVPASSDLKGSFIHAACWIQGFYIYPEMANRTQESNYYGIPKNMDFDGISDEGALCQSYTRQGLKNENCKSMEKKYYLQYQWMPFYIASLSLLYYLPYVIFRIANTDLISLKTTLAKEEVDDAEIVENYFNYNINSMIKMKVRIFFNVFIKFLYLGVSLMAYLCTDSVLFGNFKSYGINWVKWNNWNHSTAFDFFSGNKPKAGNVLLPSFGFCEIQEASMDIRYVFFNRNKFICEISPNILYQYVFVVFWFVVVISIIVSILGLILNISGHLINFICFVKEESPARSIYRVLTLRECEYLTFIRRKNIPIYGKVLRKLLQTRRNLKSMNMNIDATTPILNGTLKKSSEVEFASTAKEEPWNKL